MAFQAVPDCVGVVVALSIAGQRVINTFYGAIPGGYTYGNIVDLADEMDLWAHSVYKPLLSNQAGYTEVVVTGLANENDFEVTNADNAGVGTNASPPAANSLAFAVKRTSAFTGRSARGRVFVPLCANQLQTNVNLVTTTFRDGCETAFNSVRVSMLAAGFTEVIVSRFSNKVKRETGTYFQVVNYSATNLIVDNQRGRKPADV